MNNPPAPSAISVSELTVSYQQQQRVVEAIAGIDLEVGHGEFVSLIGPSGCGKSTLLSVIGGLRAPSAGSVRVHGQVVRSPLPDKIGFVFQEYTLYPWRSALSNVEFGLELRRVPAPERRRKAARYLDLVGLADFAAAFPRELSGGMQQRVAIARAMALEPDVLLMDEPFGALDEQTRMLLGEEVSRIATETGKSVVFVTHSLAEAVFLGDRVVVLTARPGRVKTIIEIREPRPRSVDFMLTDEFASVRGKLQRSLQEEIRQVARAGGIA